MFAQSDWAPTQSPDAIDRVNGFIDRAYNQLALEAPFLFFESEAHLALEPDVSSLSDIDKVTMAGPNTLPVASNDPWTFVTTYTSVQQAATPASYTAWSEDRRWDGRSIEFTLSDGTLVRNQIRHVWKDTVSTKWMLTVVNPWNYGAHGEGPFKFRVYTEEYAVPDTVVNVKSAHIYDSTLRSPLSVLNQTEAEELALQGYRGDLASGIPRYIFRRKHIQIPGPSTAPEVSADEETAKIDVPGGVVTSWKRPWKGPEPPGEFEYVITYGWGKRDAEFRGPGLAHWRGYADVRSETQANMETDPNVLSTTATWEFASLRQREPRFESSPSPVSDSIKVEPIDNIQTDDTAAQSVKIVLPNIEYMLGYFSGGFGPLDAKSRVSANKSGMSVRIYRRRKSSNFTNYNDLAFANKGLQKMDKVNAFFLLAEVDIDDTNDGIFYDNGEIIPDYNRRLRDTHGYQTFACYPRPDKRYMLDMRCLCRPPKLNDDEDAPLVHAEATNILIQRSMVYLYENMGNPSMSQLCYARYQEELLTLTKRYGQLRSAATPMLRRMTRANVSSRGNRFYRKWYTSSS